MNQTNIIKNEIENSKKILFSSSIETQSKQKCQNKTLQYQKRARLFFASAQSQTELSLPEPAEYRETYYFNTSEVTGRLLQTQAPTPTSVTFIRSADCNNYQVQWYYAFPGGVQADKCDFEYSRCCNLDPDLWVNSLNSSTGKTSTTFTTTAVSWTTLKGYGYYLSQGLRVRLRFQNNNYIWSEYLDQTSSSSLFMQIPGNITTPLRMSQLMNQAGFIISWNELSNSWESTLSPVGTGNGAVTYILERYYSGTGGGSWISLATTSNPYYQNTVAALGWQMNTINYFFRVSSQNSCGRISGYSAEMSYTFIDRTASFMNPPILEWSFDSVIKVRWDSVTDQVILGYNDVWGYQLHYSTSPSFASYQILTDSVTNSYTQTNYQASPGGWTLGALYYYRLTIRNIRGTSTSYSTTLTVQTPGLAQVMLAPTMLARTGYAIVVKWLPLTTDAETSRTTILHYSLRTRLSTQTLESDWIYLTSPNYLSLTFEHFSYVKGTFTHYQVRAHNVFGGSQSWSNTLVVQTPQTPQKMATPTNDLILPAAIRINWVDFANEAFKGFETITAFNVERSTNPTTGFILIAQVAGNVFSYTDTMTPAFPAGVTYYYRTNAYNLLGWGAIPSDNCIVVSDDYPGATVNLQSGAIEPKSIFLTWTPLSSLSDGRDPVSFYAVELYNSTTGMWEQKNADYANIYIAWSYNTGSVFPASTTYQFRIRPKNGVGYSLSTSNTVTVLTDGYPISMTNLIPSTVTPISMKMSWTLLTDMVQNAGDIPIYYKIEWENRETNPLNPTWDEITKESDGLKLELVYIRPAPTGVFPSGSTQRFRAVAKNNVGFGTAYSTILEMQADEVPISMTTPTVNSITPNSISFSWGEITLPAETGRDDVSFYHVKWQAPTLDWSYVTTYPTSMTKLTSITHTLPSGVFQSGINQNYQVCAMNGVGTGACGSVIAKADEVPIRMNNPTTVEVNPTNIKIQWDPITLEEDTGRDAVIFYHVDWESSPGTWKRLTTYPTPKTILSTLRHTLNALDDFLIFPSRSIQNYKVCAQNGVGEGHCGTLAVTADGVPTYADPPTIDEDDIHPTTIHITWNEIPKIENGEDEVVYYQLEWDQGSSTWTNLTNYQIGLPISKSFTHTPGGIFTSGATINYRVIARNGVGMGKESTETPVLCDEVPLFMNAAVNTSVTYKQIDLSWNPIPVNLTGRDPVIFWSLEWFDRACYTNNALTCADTYLPVDGQWHELTDYSQNGGGGTRSRLSTTFSHKIASHFYPNTNFAYRLRAKNGVGYGAYSVDTLVLTDDVPAPMNSASLLMVRSNYVTLQWDAVTGHEETGRDTLIYYSVWWDQGTGTYIQLTSNLAQLLTTNYKHQVPGLMPINQYINYKIAAQNGVGIGSVDLAQALQVKTPGRPTFMNAPFNVSVKAFEINLEWVPLDNATQWEEQGRETITYYTLEYDPNIGTFSALNPAPGSLVTTFKLSSGANPFPANVNYKFRVMATNAMGNGDYSSELVMITDDVPSQVQNVATVSIAPKIIEVKWDALSAYEDYGRDPMTYYKLEFHDNTATGSWTELTSTSIAAVTYFKHQISVPFPANIDMQDHFVKYRVYGRNLVGTGIASVDHYVLTKTYPLVMPKVTIADPQPNSIVISWTKHTDDDSMTGRDPIIHYKVLWNKIQDPLTETWVEISSFPNLASTLTVTSGYLINTNYRVKIAAQNGVGVGLYSDTEIVLTDNVPTFMYAPTEDTATNANLIKVNWEPITTVDFNGRDEVIYYKLEWDQATGIWVDASIPLNQMVTTWTFSTGIKNGSTYAFRVTPKNGVGFGATSNVMTLIPSSPPQQMNKLQVTLQSSQTDVKFAWDYPIDNGDQVNEYLIEFKDSTATFIPYTVTCDGADPTIVSQRYCYIPMSTLWGEPFNLAKGAKIVARAMAKNVKGFCSTYSTSDPALFTLVVEYMPTAPSKPTEGQDTNWNVLHVKWTQIPNSQVVTGGVTSSIKSYHLQRNTGNNSDPMVPDTWVTIHGLDVLSLALEFSTSDEIIGGTTYKLRVQALNKYGWGDWSQIKEIRCANPPADPAWINTANSTTNFYISWHLPFNMGLQIENFTIQILKKNANQAQASSWVEPSECDGSDPDINSTQSCMVPMATLRSAPYVYGLDDKIVIRIRATNLEGSGNYFKIAPGTNLAKVQTPPSAPTVVILNYPLVTNDLQIKISWTAHNTIALQGGIEVTAYEIWWTDSVFDYETLYVDTFPFKLNYLYTKLDPADVSNLAHEIVPGTQYKFKYRAVNIHGPSLFSQETIIIASFKPDKLAPPSTSLYNITLTVAWAPTPNDHSRPVTKYSVKFRTKTGVYQEDPGCVGTSTAVIDNMKCSLTATRFTLPPYNLNIDDLIQVTVEAYNVMLWSIPSNPNTIGVLAKKNPQRALTNVARGDQTGKTQIHITWTGISDNIDTGGQPVDYKIFYDKGTSTTVQNWYTLTTTTNNATSYIDYTNFKVGIQYYFKIIPWNDFGPGQFNSTPVGIWAAIVPSGQAPPTTTLTYNSYVEEDDIIVIDWEQPADNGGLTVWFNVEVMSKSSGWLLVNQNNECYELIQTTPFHMPLVAAAELGTRCTILVSTLKSKYGLLVGDTVQARITAIQQVGQVTSDGGGTAVLPVVPCFRTTFPRIIGGSDSDTHINAMDIDEKGHIVVGGYSSDNGLIGKPTAQKYPFAAYIAKGNYYAWGKYLSTTDYGAGSQQFYQVLDITFRYDGEKVAVALEKDNYDMSYMIVIINKDGSLSGAYREFNNPARGKVNVTGMIYDSSNFVTLALDYSPEGTAVKRQAVINRFSVSSTTPGNFPTQFYIIGGTNTLNAVSKVFALQRIKNDPTLFYLSALITDNTNIFRSILGKANFATGAMPKYYFYNATGYYNTPQAVAVVTRMFIYENPLINQQIISGCLMSFDGYRIHFGQFIFTGASTQSQIVLTPDATINNRYSCLGIYQKEVNTSYVVYNNRKDADPNNYVLTYGRISYTNFRLDTIDILSHDGLNNYGGAKFVHMSRFYYWGQTKKIIGKSGNLNFGTYVGFLNLFDETEIPFSCNPASQNFVFPVTGFITLTQVPPALMDWKTSGLVTGQSTFAASAVRQMRMINLQETEFQNINLNDPVTSNSWCPIVTTGGAPTIVAPTISFKMFTYDPAISASQTQSFQFNPIQVSRFCPDTVIYNLTYQSDLNSPLPIFIKFSPDDNRFIFDVFSTDNVGTYQIMLYSTLGNNKTTFTEYTAQIASPCLNNPVQVVAPPTTPIYDLSDLEPMLIDLDWVVTYTNPFCAPTYYKFKLFNATTMGDIQPGIFSIVTNTVPQKLKIWTQAIPNAKLWSDLLIVARLQGDLVATNIQNIMITNDCEPTVIVDQVMPDWIYYTGRDSIELTFVWQETIGKCGPISYSIKEYQQNNLASNNSLDASVFTYPNIVGTNNTLKIFTADEGKVGIYKIRVYASLGVGGDKQSSTVFTTTIIRDPCSYYSFTVPFIDDMTLWINQTDQYVLIPAFQMSDPFWICNFTYVITTPTNQQIDPIFKKNEVVKQGTGPNVTLDSTDPSKIELSPYTIKVKGWPSRQPIASSQSFTFRVFIAFLDKTDCPTGKYYVLATESCELCQTPCSACKGGPTDCTWCQDAYSLVDNNGVYSCILKTENCPAGTIRDAFLGTCRKCGEFCKTCISNTQCTDCIPNYNLAGGKCFPFRDCPPGFRFDDQTCIPCPSNCEACLTTTQCTYCNQGYYLNSLDNQCTQNCPAGYYGDQQSRVCMICQPSCATCVGNNYTCTSCKDLGAGATAVKYYLFGSTCVERCPYLQYYQNHANRSCDKCKPECKICVNAFDDCIVCNEGSVIAGRECLNSCPEKSYITVIGTCFPCDPACQKCTGAMNSMCSQCTENNYLTETTCEPKCNPPLFPDPSTGTCKNCPYYCNQCSTGNDCQKCKTGYLQVPNDCAGENVLKVSNSFTMSVPIDSQLDEFNPNELTSEIWFKIDNANSLFIEVILGTTPYKLRKKANVAQVQLNFDLVNYCDSYNLKSDQWYHFAYIISENPAALQCYINGDRISTGITSISLITADILKFREITFGGTNEPKSSEFKFNGYVREFRWWNTVRSAFQIKNFMDISFTTPSNKMVAYWRLNEERKTAIEFKDSVNPLLTFNPAPKLLKEVHEMREIYQKMCPEGNYGRFNETSNMQECYKCNEICKNCNGPNDNQCTECNNPYKLIEAELKCIIQEGCPLGYFEDVNKECQPCHDYCISCFNTPYQCPKCKPKYFKQYKGIGCVDACPRGLYGNYLTQSCAANPIVTSIYPDDGTIFSYGSFIDLVASFQVQNEEPRNTYSYGWIFSKLNSNIDLARDAAKPYFNTDITRVHLDNNIIEPNNYYNITFYVKGDENYYNGMIGTMYNVIYIGIPPKSGKCEISPSSGIAQVTNFQITSYGWQDVDGIAEYKYLYSFDNGVSYIPIETANSRLPSTTYSFATVFKTINGKIKCTAQSIKGFVAEDTTEFTLMKKSSANAQVEIQKLDVTKVNNEVQAVQLGNQLMQIATEIGQLKEVTTNAFNTRINPDQCSESLCSFGGKCQFDTFTKKYYCLCNSDRAGVNCTFKNQTQLQYIKNMTFDLCQKYIPMSLSGRRTYDFQFLKLVTTNMDLMSNDIFDSLTGIVSQQVNRIKSNHPLVGDNSDAENTLQILSNMLEYLALDQQTMNRTQAFKTMNGTKAEEYQANMKKNLADTMKLVEQVKNATIYRLDFLQPEVSIQTRMVSFRQFITNSDSIVTMPATQNVKKQLTTYVKISPSNFANTSIPIGKQFITETIEYAINPYQLNNTDNIGSNVFEVNLYNQDKTLHTNDITKIDVKNLVTPIEFSFPIANNQNLTDLIEKYNKLSNFKYKERLKKDEMLKKSNINCVYWIPADQAWSSAGCQLQTIDKTHLKCNCTHLSAFTFTFTTPKLTVDAPVLENTTVKASKYQSAILTLKDIIKWPLDKYFANMYELWQHNRPPFITFIIKPGFPVIILFWAMYLSSLIYYSGRDDLRRFKMTKQQNRDDLAELRDDNVQNIFAVIKDLVVKDFLMENGKFIQRQARRMKAPQLNKKQIQPPQIKIYEQLSKEEQHQYRRRARRKVFGVPAGLCDRAKRYYDITMSHNEKNPNAKMSFFNEQLKNNLWIGLIAKTSKIAPRHVRLLLMYFYASLYITLLTLIFGFQVQEMLTSNALFQVVFIAVALVPVVWVITIPVALIFRMPLHLRRLIAGVRTKKLNKAFHEVDKHMGWRYAVGYFICLTMYFIMTVCVLVFNIFYPHDYVMGWFFNIILLYLFDLIVFTFMLAGLQMVNVIISQKVKCWYHVWAAIEVFRYVKNLRG